MSARIRLARDDEAEPLTRLARRAKASWSYPPDWLTLWQAELRISTDYLRDQHVLVAEAAAELIGMIALEVHESSAALEHVWVAPEHQGTGIGSALVKEALLEAAARGIHEVSVVSDPHAEAFYLRLGAKSAGRLAAPMPGAPDRFLPVLKFNVSGQQASR